MYELAGGGPVFNERPGADIPCMDPFKASFAFNLTDESAPYIAGERGDRACVLVVDSAAIIEAIETGTIARFDDGQIAAAIDEIEKLPDGHALCQVRDSARARRHADDVLATLAAQP